MECRMVLSWRYLATNEGGGMSATMNPDQTKQWPHNQGVSDGGADPKGAVGETGNYVALPPGGQPGQLIALNERRELTWVDPPSADPILSGSGLLDKAIIPPLDEGHLPNLEGTYQSVAERDQPEGYVGLDANGKISPYRIPAITRGLQGERGEQGVRGPQGERGERGEAGPTGLQGARGGEGQPGPQGPQGPRAVLPDMSGYVVKGEPPTIALANDTLARDLAYFLAERGLIRLV